MIGVISEEIEMNIQAKATEVRANAGFSERDLPVDLMQIAKHLGLDVYYAEFNDPEISGMLITDASRVPEGVEAGECGTIFLKRGEYPPRSRFTLAHEIGHYVLGHINPKGGVITDRFRGKETGHSNPEESDANNFAGELLMPKMMFIPLWESHLTIEEMTVVFGVSAAAVTTRAKVLNLEEHTY